MKIVSLGYLWVLISLLDNKKTTSKTKTDTNKNMSNQVACMLLLQLL